VKVVPVARVAPRCIVYSTAGLRWSPGFTTNWWAEKTKIARTTTCTRTHFYMTYIPVHERALSDFDGDFLPDLGTQHPPAEICPDNSSLSPIALKIGLKSCGLGPASFEPMYVWFGLNSNYPGKRGIILGQNFESGFRRRISKKKNHDCIVVWWKNIFFRKEKLKCTTANVIKW